MKVHVTNNGIVIKAETQTEAWALKAIFPAGEPLSDWCKKIVIEMSVDQEPPCNE